ncbi:hypothetical protein PR048_008737 [Dryococelus australis]|uniref:Uncharacterized protein n=1 Tax=Dryococelus australis TaxID=614101 RepID=A0ABQ9HYU1_9NEOP|nr:hypothetical protein PR048_008737 [Dryococelus australis]
MPTCQPEEWGLRHTDKNLESIAEAEVSDVLPSNPRQSRNLSISSTLSGGRSPLDFRGFQVTTLSVTMLVITTAHRSAIEEIRETSPLEFHCFPAAAPPTVAPATIRTQWSAAGEISDVRGGEDGQRHSSTPCGGRCPTCIQHRAGRATTVQREQFFCQLVLFIGLSPPDPLTPSTQRATTSLQAPSMRQPGLRHVHSCNRHALFCKPRTEYPALITEAQHSRHRQRAPDTSHEVRNWPFVTRGKELAILNSQVEAASLAPPHLLLHFSIVFTARGCSIIPLVSLGGGDEGRGYLTWPLLLCSGGRPMVLAVHQPHTAMNVVHVFLYSSCRTAVPLPHSTQASETMCQGQSDNQRSVNTLVITLAYHSETQGTGNHLDWISKITSRDNLPSRQIWSLEDRTSRAKCVKTAKRRDSGVSSQQNIELAEQQVAVTVTSESETDRWKQEGTTTTKLQPGRPCVLTDRDSQALKMVREQACVYVITITHEFCIATNCAASTMTVRRKLRTTVKAQATAHKLHILPYLSNGLLGETNASTKESIKLKPLSVLLTDGWKNENTNTKNAAAMLHTSEGMPAFIDALDISDER